MGENVTTLICLAPALLCVGTFHPLMQTMSNTCPQESVAVQTTRERCRYYFINTPLNSLNLLLHRNIRIYLMYLVLLPFDIFDTICSCQTSAGDVAVRV